MGTIMAVVAVLEIHMERNMVGSMKPSISSRGLVPYQEDFPKSSSYKNILKNFKFS
jgi:hypothetical protein